MISAYSPWVAAHGKLWYDDKWYRIGWVVWPQALAAVLVLWFWLTPSTDNRTAQWAVPLDYNVRNQQLRALLEAAKSDKKAMDTLERDARGGEMDAQYVVGTLYDPDLKLSTVVQPNFDKAMEWYGKAAAQGQQSALSNLVLSYSQGILTRVDYTRACYYALKLDANANGNALNVKGDCYARGLGGTGVNPGQADAAYKAAAVKGATRTTPLPSQPAPTAPSYTPQAFVPPAPSPLPVNPTPPPLIPNPTLPDQPERTSDTAWGALAFTLDGSYSTAWKVASQFEAEAKVAKQCAEFGRGGCKVISFSGQECAALATYIGGRRRSVGSYTAGGTTFPEAQQAAMNRCNADDRSRGRCQFRTAVCADGR
jgi:Domain of unknown function (DUF4189)